MTRFLDMEPATDAELFDMVHGLFGIGDYSDEDEKPYHRFRMVEIGKIKALRKKRGITIAQLATTARYCFRHQKHVHSVFGLVEHIGRALREQQIERQQQLGDRMLLAATEAQQAGEADWASRLLRVQGPYRQPALDEWEAHKRTLAGVR